MIPKHGNIELKRAEAYGKKVVEQLAPFCEKIEIAGSIRRRRPWVNDVDIVLVPKELQRWELLNKIMKLGGGAAQATGNKIIRFRLGDIPIDIYIATEEIWATLLLIRTGSANHNKKLCSRAQEYGWKLHADGSGLFNEKGERIAGDTEESIFFALRMKYLEPRERS